MKAITHYQFEDGDVPSAKQLREAFNLLYEFTPVLRDPESPITKAFHSVVDQRSFTREHFLLLKDYGLMVAKAAEEKYQIPEWLEAPWRDAILQNCALLRSVMIGLQNSITDSERPAHPSQFHPLYGRGVS